MTDFILLGVGADLQITEDGNLTLVENLSVGDHVFDLRTDREIEIVDIRVRTFDRAHFLNDQNHHIRYSRNTNNTEFLCCIPSRSDGVDVHELLSHRFMNSDDRIPNDIVVYELICSRTVVCRLGDGGVVLLNGIDPLPLFRTEVLINNLRAAPPTNHPRFYCNADELRLVTPSF